jgi:hypothetical protein
VLGVLLAQVCKTFWDVRKGLIPIVGAAREPGTSMLIEDVACPVDKLADMMIDLIDMFQRFGYHDASCFGHALEGNLHLVFSQVRLERIAHLRPAQLPMQHSTGTPRGSRFSAFCFWTLRSFRSCEHNSHIQPRLWEAAPSFQILNALHTSA